MLIDDFLLEFIIVPWNSFSDFETAGTLIALLVLALVILDAIIIAINKIDSIHYNYFVFILAIFIVSSLFVFFYWYIALPLYLVFIKLILLSERKTAIRTLYNLQKGVKTFRIDDLVRSGILNDSLKEFKPSFAEYKYLLLPKKWKIVYFSFTPIIMILLLMAYGLHYVFF